MPLHPCTERGPGGPVGEHLRAEMLKRFDKDGAGRLNTEERAEAMKALMSDHPDMVPPGW